MKPSYRRRFHPAVFRTLSLLIEPPRTIRRMPHVVRKSVHRVGRSMTPAGRRARDTLAIARLRAFVADDSAATSIEYSLLASLIALAIAGVCGALFSRLSSEYTEIAAIFN